jgi:hypothetical protein
MEKEYLSEILHIRVTPRMKRSLEAEASRLAVRPVDITRMAIAWVLSNREERWKADSIKRYSD